MACERFYFLPTSPAGIVSISAGLVLHFALSHRCAAVSFKLLTQVEGIRTRFSKKTLRFVDSVDGWKCGGVFNGQAEPSEPAELL